MLIRFVSAPTKDNVAVRFLPIRRVCAALNESVAVKTRVKNLLALRAPANDAVAVKNLAVRFVTAPTKELTALNVLPTCLLIVPLNDKLALSVP